MEAESHYVALSVSDLDQTGFELTQIHLLLPPKPWGLKIIDFRLADFSDLGRVPVRSAGCL